MRNLSGKGVIWVVLSVLFFGVSATASVEVAGIVVDDNGEPVENADVVLLVRNFDNAMMQVTVKERFEIKTGADGKFTFETKDHSNQATVLGQIIASKDGYSLAWLMSPGYLFAGQDLELVLGHPGEISGKVVDSQGEPVAGALVEISFAAFARNEFHENPLIVLGEIDELTSVTDGDGNFTIGHLPKGITAEFILSKAGYARIGTFDEQTYVNQNSLTYRQEQRDIEIVLPAAKRVTGIVTGEDGEPISGVEVLFSSQNLIFDIRMVVSDADGRFVFDEVGPGICGLQTRVGDDSVFADAAQEITIRESDEQKEIELTLQRGGRLEVTVQDKNGEPVPGATVHVLGVDHKLANANGVGLFNIAPGDYNIMVHSPKGNARATATVRVGDTTKVTAKLEKHPDMPGMTRLSGIVRDPNGVPLQGVEFQTMPVHVHMRASSDSEGRFSLQYHVSDWHREQGDFLLIARHKDKNLVKSLHFTEETEELDIELEPAILVKALVVGPDGEPVGDAQITRMFWQGNSGRSFGASNRADERGYFELKALPHEHVRIELRVQTDVLGRVRRDLVFSDAVDGVLDLGILELPVAEMSVSGVVVDIDDNPVANAQVHVSNFEQPGRTVQTDAEGQFTLNNLVEGRVHLNCSYRVQNNSMHANVDAQAGDSDVKIVLMSQNMQRVIVPEPQIESLQGKVCPDVSELGVEVEIDGRALAICFVDVGQRVSRRFLSELADIYTSADESIQIIVVQIEGIDEDMFSQLTGEYPFEIAFPVADNYTELQAKWGVSALPWIVTTDSERIVLEEGISIQSLQQF